MFNARCFDNCNFVQILLLCVEGLLADWSAGEGGPISCPGDEKLKNAAVKQDLRRLIVKYANKYREPLDKVMKYDCNLEKKARPGIKNDERFDMEMLEKQKYAFSEYPDELMKGMKLKDYVEKGLTYWLTYSNKGRTTIRGLDNNRIGCHYKKGKFFHFVCLYDQLGPRVRRSYQWSMIAIGRCYLSCPMMVPFGFGRYQRAAIFRDFPDIFNKYLQKVVGRFTDTIY
ncbi:hypothetical protein ANCCAN_26066 [Ancylostoma caninum]|uniref:SCP domain-containing protein n=1 Tax=Ancylostoma caninum TaxID=29170 RepID=A0A368FBJ1_ANCCA|nr:hypothetical protein ANCCAN_26066 [Ancylostoma caninum]